MRAGHVAGQIASPASLSGVTQPQIPRGDILSKPLRFSAVNGSYINKIASYTDATCQSLFAK